MALDVRGLVEQMVRDETFQRVVNNPLAQFGTVQEPFLGATLLPEMEKPENSYVEEAIRYRTVVANDGTRYSPVQIKGGILTGSFLVRLGESDIGSHFTGSDYDALIRLLTRYGGAIGNTKPDMQTVASLVQWADMTLARPLQVKNEKMRWEAIVDSVVPRAGDGGFIENVSLSNPTGQRVNCAGQWSSNAYDPWNDIMAGVNFLANKGYTVGRIIAPMSVVTKLSMNVNVRQRLGINSLISGSVVGLAGRASLGQINGLLENDNLPPIERYDRQYRTQNGSGFFLKRDCFVMVATTARDQEIDRADLEPLLIQNTLGYMGIGRPAGQSSPGRRVLVTPFENKPPRIEGEAWQTSFPVITEPEAMYVIKNIT